jgi:hypothetical protein
MDSEYLFASSPQSKQWAEHADQELATIENIKLDISGKFAFTLLCSLLSSSPPAVAILGLEYDYSLTLQKIRSDSPLASRILRIYSQRRRNESIGAKKIE